MLFDRQLLFLALSWGGARVTGLAIAPHHAPIETGFPSSSDLVANQHDLLPRIQTPRAIPRAPRPADAQSSPSTTPGLAISASQPAGSESASFEAIPAAAFSSVAVTSIALPSSSPMATNDPLSILLSALSSSIRDELSTDASHFLSTFLESSTPPATTQPSATPSSNPFFSFTASTSASIFLQSSAPPSQSTFSASQSSRPPTSSQHGTHIIVHPTNHHTNTHTSSRHTTSHTSSHTTLTTSTSTSSSSTSTTPLLSQTTPTPTPGSDPAHPIDNAQIAGISAGIGAAAVLGVLAAFYIWRRKSGDGHSAIPLFGARHGSQRSEGSSVYPKAAWLYDPIRTPSKTRSRSGSEAEQNLLPNPVSPNSRPLMAEMEEADLGLGVASPSFRPQRASSPLLQPQRAIPEIRIEGDDSDDGGSGYRNNPGGRRGRPVMG